MFHSQNVYTQTTDRQMQRHTDTEHVNMEEGLTSSESAQLGRHSALVGKAG